MTDRVEIDHRVEGVAGYVYVGETRIGWTAVPAGRAGYLWPAKHWQIPTDEQFRSAWEALVAESVPSFAGDYDHEQHVELDGPQDWALRSALGQDSEGA